MKRKPLLILVILSFVLLLASPVVWITFQLRPVSPSSSQTQTIVVTDRQTTSEVHSLLESKRLIRSALAARIYLRIVNNVKPIQPGSHVLSSSQSLPEILLLLSQPPKDLWVTFPEGWRREQIANRLNGLFSSQPGSKFDPVEFLNQTRGLEGQLFPDTYLIPVNATASDVVKLLTANFARKSPLQLPEDRDLLIIASLIEREVKSPDQLATISGIIHNRLAQGWLLNLDATIQYARDSQTCSDPACRYWTPITDTSLENPYNTYLHPGLPPGPICNPGSASQLAAKSPGQTDYMYYLHDSSGQVHYARTLQQHQQNIDKYLKS